MERPSRAQAVAPLLATVLLLSALLAGCLSFPLAQRVLPPLPSAVVQYRDQPLASYEYTFTTDYGALIGGDSAALYASVTYARDDPLNVTSGTQWLRLDLNASFDAIPQQAREALRQTCRNFANFDCSLEPSMRVRLSTPDGELWFDQNYTTQTTTFLHVESPMAGAWLLQVTATGYSTNTEHDAIGIAAIANEPAGPRHG